MRELSDKHLFDLTNITILIAEDDPISRMIVSKMLEIKKASVLKAENGYEAIELLSKSPTVNVVILDLEMPKLNGYDTVKKIREHLPSIPVIAITASMIDKKMEASLKEHGFTDSMSKPFKADTFFNKITDALKEHVQF